MDTLNTNYYHHSRSWIIISGIILFSCQALFAQKELPMDKMWGAQDKVKGPEFVKTAIFDDGNYAMFIHWGLYSNMEK